jgi:hypothetical protein
MRRYIEVGIRKKERKKKERKKEEHLLKQGMRNAGKQLSFPLHFILHEGVITTLN